jgi:hypothetical protein
MAVVDMLVVAAEEDDGADQTGAKEDRNANLGSEDAVRRNSEHRVLM